MEYPFRQGLGEPLTCYGGEVVDKGASPRNERTTDWFLAASCSASSFWGPGDMPSLLKICLFIEDLSNPQSILSSWLWIDISCGW